jgi:DNA-binding transcriptional LysR family regulator
MPRVFDSPAHSPSRPNLRHLAVVAEVARRGSAQAAARAAFLSQPAVTQAIAAVERYLGGALFVRSASGMAPLPAARSCLARIDRALAELRAAGAGPLLHAPGGAGGLRGVSVALLEALIAVVEQGGAGAAARALGVSRPTLHRAMRSLGSLTGAVLFEQTSFGLTPTREAARLARHAQLAFAELAQARAELAAAAGAEVGRTVVGVMPLARSALVPRALMAFADRHPAHTVELLDGTYESLLVALRGGRAHVLVGALRDPAPAADVQEEFLFEDPLALVVRARHPLTRLRGPGPARADLARYPWIAPRRGSPLRSHYERLFPVDPPGGVVECNSLEVARALLLHSDRVMLASARPAGLELESGLLAVLPHPDGPVARRIGLTLRRSWQPTATQAELIAQLRAEALTLA